MKDNKSDKAIFNVKTFFRYLVTYFIAKIIVVLLIVCGSVLIMTMILILSRASSEKVISACNILAEKENCTKMYQGTFTKSGHHTPDGFITCGCKKNNTTTDYDIPDPGFPNLIDVIKTILGLWKS